MRIGELAERSGVNIETIRYYERAGILPGARRAANNYRVYQHSHLRRLRFVRRARDLGFTLDDVRALIGLIEGGAYTCAEVQALGQRHLDAVRARLADLRRMETALADVVARCSGEASPDCSMLEHLFEG